MNSMNSMNNMNSMNSMNNMNRMNNMNDINNMNYMNNMNSMNNMYNMNNINNTNDLNNVDDNIINELKNIKNKNNTRYRNNYKDYTRYRNNYKDYKINESNTNTIISDEQINESSMRQMSTSSRNYIKRNKSNNFPYRRKTSIDRDFMKYKIKNKSKNNKLVDKIKYLTNRIDKVVEQYTDKNNENRKYDESSSNISHSISKYKYDINSFNKRNSLYENKNRGKNRGRYLDTSKTKYDYEDDKKIFKHQMQMEISHIKKSIKIRMQ